MYIVDVWTIDTSVPAGSITYRSKELLTVGSWIRVPVGKKKIWGIIGSCTPIRQAKIVIKSATYQIKDIHPLELLPGIPSIAFEKITQCLPNILPTEIVHSLFSPLWAQQGKHTTYTKNTTTYHQGSLVEFTENYISKNKDTSTVWVCPHILSVQNISDTLTKQGIPHVCITKKPSEKIIETIASSSVHHVVCTPTFAFPWFPNTTCIISEYSNSHYRQQSVHKNFYSRSTALVAFWQTMTSQLIIHDWALPFGVLAHTNTPRSYNFNIPTSIVSYEKYTKKKSPRKTADNIMNTIVDAVERTLQKNPQARILILTQTKHDGSGISCTTCSSRITCDACKTQLVTKQENDQRVSFFCRICTKSITAFDRCPTCAGPTLCINSPGVTRITRELSELFSDIIVQSIAQNDTHTDRIITQLQKAEKIESPCIINATPHSAESIGHTFTHCLVVPGSWWFGIESTSTEQSLRTLLRLAHIIPRVYIPLDTVTSIFFSTEVPDSWEKVYQTDVEARQRFDPGSLLYPPLQS